jgi:chemotaxis protein CheC
MVGAQPYSELRFDVLKELANIGIGNATTALSQLLNYEKMVMYVPEVSLAPLSDIPDLMGGAENPVVGVFVKAPGEVSLNMVFLLSIESAETLISCLTGNQVSVDDSMGRSVLLEVGNILTASYLNTLSFMTNMTFLPSPPLLARDMAGAILGTVLAEANVTEDYILVLKTAIATENRDIEGSFLIIPDLGSIDLVVKLLVEGAYDV